MAIGQPAHGRPYRCHRSLFLLAVSMASRLALSQSTAFMPAAPGAATGVVDAHVHPYRQVIFTQVTWQLSPHV